MNALLDIAVALACVFVGCALAIELTNWWAGRSDDGRDE